jgi:starch-binding outer membrane protein, SusD/RagB family
MKKFNIILIIIFAGSMLYSCKKSFLNEKASSSYSPQNTLKDSLGLESAITGLQASVREQYTTGTYQSLITCFQVGTDVAIGANIKGEEVPYYNYATLNSQDPIALYCWTWAYKVINNANQIIQGVSDPSTPLSTAGRNGFLAEAKFFRAYAYNFLATLYGAVPLIDVPLTAPKTNFTRASLDSVNNFIVQDLIFSETNLPAITGVKKPGRISKEAAYQLLGEVYLRMNKADLAETELQKVISSGMFSLIAARYGVRKDQAGDPFSDMFIVGNQRRRQGNTEAIWVEEQEYNMTGGSANNGDQHRRVWVNNYYQNSGMTICDSLGGRGQARLRLSYWVINGLYVGNDMRNSRYNLRRDFYYNNPASPKFGQKVVPTAADTLAIFPPYTTKWNYTVPANLSIAEDYKDLIMMRLGETYLLLAEAQFKQGKLPQAAASINVLRNRAQATPVQASDITIDFILDERARELIGEENRRMTLVRTGTLVDRVKKLNFKESSTIQDYNKLLPIPQSEIDLNKDAKLEQNPGYN